MTQDLIDHVTKAQELAENNRKKYPNMSTVLFFDEANSTEAIGTIKEILCDYRINGVQLNRNCGLKIIAACNPYRKHNEDIIKNFEKAGLGYYSEKNEIQDKLGNLPMRELVYRVQPLPESMLPLIWDFGSLNDDVEKLYIKQIIENQIVLATLHKDQLDILVDILTTSQQFMREQKNECSFVSLRNVQRVLIVLEWFLNKGKPILEKITTNIDAKAKHFVYSVTLSLNVCYLVSLQTNESRKRLCNKIASKFKPVKINENDMVDIIDSCYSILLNEITTLESHIAIAHNQALKENIFMMIIAIELKIPLFIVGKLII